MEYVLQNRTVLQFCNFWPFLTGLAQFYTSWQRVCVPRRSIALDANRTLLFGNVA
jgi:hypothetical protein